MYKIQEKGKPETAIWLVKVETLLTNCGQADLHFKSHALNHATVTILADNQDIFIDCPHPELTITVNNTPITHKTSLNHQDIVRIGETVFEIINPQRAIEQLIAPSNIERDPRYWQLQSLDGPVGKQRYQLESHSILGNAPDCHIYLQNQQLSRHHAEFIVTGGKVLMKDLDATGGCYVNNKRHIEAILDDGDEIRLGIMRFRLIAPLHKAGLHINKPHAVNTASIQEKNNPPKTTEPKTWKTKPTSSGNRLNDSIDAILANHQRLKKISTGLFFLSTATLCIISLILLG